MTPPVRLLSSQSWPSGLQDLQPDSWAWLSFGLPVYQPRRCPRPGTLTLRHRLNGVQVKDISVGGWTTCGGAVRDYFQDWGDRTAWEFDPTVGSFNVQNQSDISDWPCFSKNYLTFHARRSAGRRQGPERDADFTPVRQFRPSQRPTHRTANSGGRPGLGRAHSDLEQRSAAARKHRARCGKRAANVFRLARRAAQLRRQLRRRPGPGLQSAAAPRFVFSRQRPPQRQVLCFVPFERMGQHAGLEPGRAADIDDHLGVALIRYGESRVPRHAERPGFERAQAADRRSAGAYGGRDPRDGPGPLALLSFPAPSTAQTPPNASQLLYLPIIHSFSIPALQPTDWPQYGRDPQRTNASPQAVEPPYCYAWKWYAVPFASRLQPVVAGGRLYVGGMDGVCTPATPPPALRCGAIAPADRSAIRPE